MFFLGAPKNKEESKRRHRLMYENDKEGFVALFHEQGFDEKYLNQYLVDNLKRYYEEELREDGLLS